MNHIIRWISRILQQAAQDMPANETILAAKNPISYGCAIFMSLHVMAYA